MGSIGSKPKTLSKTDSLHAQLKHANKERECRICLLKEQNEFLSNQIRAKQHALYERKLASAKSLIMSASNEAQLGGQIRKLQKLTGEKEQITRMMRQRYRSLTTVHTHFIVKKGETDV